MRHLVILGASALVLALGVAQASAEHQSSGQSWADYVARTSSQPAYTGELRDFRAQPADQSALQATDQPPYGPSYSHGSH
jgi:hypothetical protein